MNNTHRFVQTFIDFCLFAILCFFFSSYHIVHLLLGLAVGMLVLERTCSDCLTFSPRASSHTQTRERDARTCDDIHDDRAAAATKQGMHTARSMMLFSAMREYTRGGAEMQRTNLQMLKESAYGFVDTNQICNGLIHICT